MGLFSTCGVSDHHGSLTDMVIYINEISYGEKFLMYLFMRVLQGDAELQIS